MNRFTGLTLVLLLFSVCLSFGQEEESNNYISKRQWMLGGTMSLSTSDDFINSPTFIISPTAGYFIGNRLALGVELKYSFYEVHSSNPATGEEISYTSSSLSANPFARYYFGTGKVAPFVEGAYNMNWYFDNGEKTRDNAAYKIGTGLNYFISPSLALDGKLSYTRYTHEASINPLSLGVGLQFFLSRNETASEKEMNATFLARGAWMIGGSIHLSISDNDNADNLYQEHRINPMAGYFLTDKLTVGLMANYFFRNYFYSRTESLSASPFVRYYFAIKKLAPFTEASFGGGTTEVGYFDGFDWQTVKDENFTYHVAAGLNYFLTDFVALETKLSYFKNNNLDQGSLNLQAGISFFLQRNK